MELARTRADSADSPRTVTSLFESACENPAVTPLVSELLLFERAFPNQARKIFGIEIGLHYSWFLIALLIVASLDSQFHQKNPEWGDGAILAMSIVTGVLFFVSLLLHELSHSIFARSRGLPVKEITLFALGGVSQIEKEPTSAKTEFWMAFAGP